MRGLLDGHIWLARKLAERGHYPAIDILRSISRLMNEITSPEQQQAVLVLRQLLAVHAENEDLLSIGAYRQGNNKTLDVAVQMREAINQLLQQQTNESSNLEKVKEAVIVLGQQCQERLNVKSPNG